MVMETSSVYYESNGTKHYEKDFLKMANISVFSGTFKTSTSN